MNFQKLLTKNIKKTILFLFFGFSLYAQKTNQEIIGLLKNKFPLTQYDRPDEIIRFNKDIILVTGYLEDLSSKIPRHEQKINTIYKTIDGGINWKVVNYDGNAWIYTSVNLQNGKIWMGGSDNYIHYSEDFGENWKKMITPFVPINRVLSIYMLDDKIGVAGGLSNGLALTYDNWQTVTQIPTPIDQNKFKISPNSSRNRIDKVEIIDSLILINQNDYFYYSKINPISWNEFKVPIFNFSINQEKKEIDIESIDSKHFLLDSNLNLIKSYSLKEFENYFSPLPKIGDIQKLDNYFSYPIKTIKIQSKNYVFDKTVHMSALFKEKIQTADISFKKNSYVFKTKKNKSHIINFDQLNLKSILLDESEKSLNQFKTKFKFSDEDFKKFNNYLDDQTNIYKENDYFGGNPSIKINPELVTSYSQKEIQPIFNSVDIENVFIKYNNYVSFFNDKKDHIEMILKNSNDEEIKISNYNSVFFSLPWTITYNNETYNSFNPELTYFVRSIIPPNFTNYKLLFGGDLIYEVLKQDLINKIDYK